MLADHQEVMCRPSISVTPITTDPGRLQMIRLRKLKNELKGPLLPPFVDGEAACGCGKPPPPDDDLVDELAQRRVRARSTAGAGA